MTKKGEEGAKKPQAGAKKPQEGAKKREECNENPNEFIAFPPFDAAASIRQFQ